MLSKIFYFFGILWFFLVPGLVLPVGGSLLNCVDFPLVQNILPIPERLFGFHSTQKLRYRASRAKPFKLT